MALSKKRCYPAGFDITFNDEQLNSVVEHWPRFITLEAQLSDQQTKPLTKVSPFIIQKAIQGIIGTPKSVKKLRSGALLIEVTKKQQSTSLLSLKMLADIPVVGKIHSGLNQSKGILFDRDHDLDDIPEQEIQSELESQGVVFVKRFTKKRNDNIEPTNTYLLTFGIPTLPTSIKVGLYNMKVEMFVPNPLRCFKYQRFGHGQSNCKGSESCFRCGEEGHDGKDCHNDPKCKNCKGGHMASSKQCLMWKKEKEIQKVKAEKRIPYPEAKKLVNMYSVLRPNLTSYATVVKTSSLKDMSTQVSEKDFLQQTSSCQTLLSSQDKGKNTSLPASAGPAAPKTVAVASSQPAAWSKLSSSGRKNRSPSKNNSKQQSDRLP
ncbi:uncharacterized protein LOC134271053 [Saccostrea cucullata]|uniref:uncharacterized protein LOC134271053 n=1 Tax=Saccostrea cuccullata TaxID=36930 RepID=UPI002ED1FF07